ncbi:MAG TPA: porin [Thermoanaerobaculia bacterium]|nr:porin [Thermoanaerobaculia bacterium]
MRRSATLRACLVALVVALLAGSVARAQVAGLYYQEVEKDGRVYVFNTPEKYKAWQESGDMGIAITLISRGPNGETIVAENETAMDLYLFKHNLPAYDRPSPKAAAPSAYPSTKIGGRVYADVTSKEIEDKGTHAKSGDSGVGVDVKRFYFTVTHELNAVWSAQFQSDIGDKPTGSRRYDVFVKKAYIQAKLSPAATFRLGSADTAWVPFVEGLYGYRYVENELIDRLSFGTSADWGLHFLGKTGMVSYQFSAENGRGYSDPARSKTVDFEGRVSAEPVKGLTFAVGGYSGKRGLATKAPTTTPDKHTAQRLDALVAWVADRYRFGGEYFSADNWTTVTSVAKDSADGYSAWFSVGLDPANTKTVFGKYETADPSKDIRPALQDTYYDLGLQWRPNKAFAGSLVYKWEEVEGGNQGTTNGTIGSLVAGKKGEYNEIGFWFVYDF